MSAGDKFGGPGSVIMRDAAGGRWLQFCRLRKVVSVCNRFELLAALRRVEREVAEKGLWAAGFVTYEAAPAFDGALAVRDGSGLPLLWFGLYEGVEPIELPDPARECGSEAADWHASVSPHDFHDNIGRIKALIHRGDTYQVNYTYRLRRRFAAEPWLDFLHLAAAHEPLYGAFLDLGEWVIASASPELFFRLDGERIESRPMKGTAARGLTPAQDLAQASALHRSEKERAENVMIVDMVRHDLGRVARVGSIQVPRLFELEKYPSLWQMTSTVQARTDAGLCEIFGALFPPASVTGAPRVRTMEIIAQLESAPRSIYTGAVGFIAPGRRAQFNVAIRTLLYNRACGWAEYGVGSGITWDSQPEAEREECRTKARILEAPAPPFRLLETMRWTPGEGFFLLERHLRRLEESAGYFGFALTLQTVRAELEALAQRLPHEPQRVRLLVAKDGSVTVEAAALPGPAAEPPRVALAAAPVARSNPFLYHKTTNRCLYDAASASFPDFHDVLLFNEAGEVTESTRANVAAELGGKRVTPPVECGLLPGTLRADLLARGELAEQRITVEQLLRLPEVFLLNSVRGLYRVRVMAP